MSLLAPSRQFKTNVADHGLYSLENALLEEPGKVNYLLEQVVLRFILNLRPNTRNTR
jgi:hypothetical protein